MHLHGVITAAALFSTAAAATVARPATPESPPAAQPAPDEAPPKTYKGFDPLEAVVGVWVVDIERLLTDRRFEDDRRDPAMQRLYAWLDDIAWEFTPTREFLMIGHGKRVFPATFERFKSRGVLVKSDAPGAPPVEPIFFDDEHHFTIPARTPTGVFEVPWVRLFDHTQPAEAPAADALDPVQAIVGEWSLDLAAMRETHAWQMLPEPQRETLEALVEAGEDTLVITSDTIHDTPFAVRAAYSNTAILEVGAMNEQEGDLYKLTLEPDGSLHLFAGWQHTPYKRSD